MKFRGGPHLPLPRHWSYYINTEDNYERLIDFLSQISKLFNFNVLDLADFMMHHWCPVCFFCAKTVAHLYLQYVFRFELRHQLAVQADLS